MPHGVQVMSEWLAEKKLDRKLLGTLSANLAAAEAWEEWEADQVLTVLEGLVAEVVGEPREAAAELDVPEASDADEVPLLSPCDDEVPHHSPVTPDMKSEQCAVSTGPDACSPGRLLGQQDDGLQDCPSWVCSKMLCVPL